MFPEKLAEAGVALAKYGLPKGWEKKIPAQAKELENELIEVMVD